MLVEYGNDHSILPLQKPKGVTGYSSADDVQSDPDLTGPVAKMVKFDSEETSDLRCDTCGAVFCNLTQFMDHRNFECSPATGNETQWTIENLAVNMAQPDSPLSWDSGDEGLSLEMPLSPGLENLTPEDVPGVVGVSQTNPYGCHFCDKAFIRQSYLKIHEQIHGDQLPFKCSVCNRRFRHKRSRDRHVKLHTGEKKYKCTQCQAAFVRSDHLKSHMKTHESTKVSFQCEICQLTFPSLDLMMSHMATHEQSPERKGMDLKCMYCPLVFTTLSDFRHHLIDHEKVPSQNCLCSLCGSVFPSQEDLDNHVEKVHLDESRNKCPLCSEVFLNLFDLYAHMSSHGSEIKSQGAGQVKSLPGSSLQGEVLVCPYCFCSDFDTLEVLEIHMQSVHSVKPAEVYTCNYCNAPYKNLYSLHEHMRAVHQNQPCLDIKYPCSLCSRQFGSIETLIQHKRALHPNEHRKSKAELLKHAMLEQCRPEPAGKQKKVHMQTSLKIPTPRKTNFTNSNYRGTEQRNEEITCEQCNARFHDYLHYQNHMKMHLETKAPVKLQEALSSPGLNSGVSPVSVSSALSPGVSGVPCKNCNLRFPNEEQLEKHSVSHYLSVSTEYGCTTCVKLFSKPDELQKHLMDIHAHHLYRCALCKEIFDSKVNIQVHFAIKHSNECKLYRCTKCDAVFRTEMEWSVHLRVNHLQIAKPYRCLFCKDSFSSEMELQCHLTTHSRPFKCSMCSESFHVEYLLDKHVQSVHSTEEGDRTQTPSQHGSERATPKSQHSPAVKIKTEKDIMDLNYGGSKEPLSESFFSSRASPGIWKSSDLTFTCNICDMKFSHHPALLSHKAHDHGLSAILKAVSGEQDTKPQPLQENCQNLEKDKSPGPLLNKDRMSLSPAEMSSPISKSLPVFISPERISISCMYCSQTFKNRHEMDKHMKIHLNNGDEKCNICDRVFPTPSILAEHKLTHCKIKEGNVCVLCKVALKSEEQFYIHTQEHGFQSTYIQCLICRQTLVSMVELQMHGRHHFQSTNSSFTCCVCLEAFKSKETMVSKVNSSGRNYFVCKMCYHGSKSLYHCDTCGDSFVNPLQLEAHVVTHHGNKQEYTCHRCQATFQSSLLLKAHNLSQHASESTSEFSCTHCPASFSTHSQLESHHQTHRKSYTCIKCQESFDSEQEIQLHVATHVMKEGNVHECKLCFLSFTSPAKLQCHLIQHTYQNSEYRCSVCCHVFTTAADIQQHAVEHGLGARRYACPNCCQKFFFSAELENHQISHHGGQDDNNTANKQPLKNGKEMKIKKENLYNVPLLHDASHKKLNGKSTELHCPACSQIFFKLSELTNHIQEHCEEAGNGESDTSPNGDFKSCPACESQFTNLRDLQDHLKTDHSDTKLICSICKKTFTHSKTLKLHMRLHNASKGYECTVCHKRFTRKENRKAHMKTHKGLKSTLFQCLAETNEKPVEMLNTGNEMTELASETELLAMNGVE
ncbi:zinc finger protein 423-like [Saccostrea echinata]|uniref:zinc finger protein 423-like n=1 Tax=Saccostrea echinata TaxID=191078 RepID=UPI002A8023FB|nr:zinc finger protein 423-like [Saccostrea echinata]